MQPDQLHQPDADALVVFGDSGKSLRLPRTVCFSLQKTYLTVSYFFRMQHLQQWNSVNNWQVWVPPEVTLPQIALREDLPSFLFFLSLSFFFIKI